MTLLKTIETDLTTAGKWLETEFEDSAQSVWSVVSSVFTTQEPVAVAQVLSAIKTFLPTVLTDIAKGTSLTDLETAFINWIKPEETILLGYVENLGSLLVQALLALAIKSI